MKWVVDTCILLDIALEDARFGKSSARLLATKQKEGLITSHVSFIELAPQFDADVKELSYFLRELGVDIDEPWLSEDRNRAATAYSKYVELKQANSVPKRPVADILIGAFACRFKGLITRNPADFRPYFKELKMVG
jgi:predicted nucleic acid-binding protein